MAGPKTQTPPADQTTEETAVSPLLASMQVETELNVPLRGRGFDQDVIDIRAELEKCQTENTARSFQNVDEDNKETYARKVRSAGAMNPEIEVATRYIKGAKKLVWGPKSVLDAIGGKKSKTS